MQVSVYSKKNESKNKIMLKNTAIFIILMCAFVFLLSAVAAIPNTYIEKNMKKTALYYREHSGYEHITDKENSFVIHNYADSIWFNIAYSLNCGDPFVSAVEAPMYKNENISSTEALYEYVNGEKAPNDSYSRYWHGALVIIKPLLMLTDIQGIRVINAVALASSSLILCVMLFRKKAYSVLVGFIIANICCSTYLVPLCMEYMPCILLSNIFSIIIILDSKKTDPSFAFVVFGALTCYFDFFTNEIITLCIPLIILLYVKNKNMMYMSSRASFSDAVKYISLWFCGFVVTWLVKWMLVLVTLGKGAFFEVLRSGKYRLTTAYTPTKMPAVSAIFDNIKQLSPLKFISDDTMITAVFLLLLAVLFSFFYLYRYREKKALPMVMFLLALTPYLRYAVLYAHSQGHAFFTYRSQMIAIIAVTVAFSEGFDTGLFLKGGRSKCRK